ncbi:MAG: hypothetical protein LBM97_01500 [Candidatus Nomurabacteria bacterium]|jgi:hypothetical protein|nr:hypothetical protein [Candidatus Nomurabacteria bacterium]
MAKQKLLTPAEFQELVNDYNAKVLANAPLNEKVQLGYEEKRRIEEDLIAPKAAKIEDLKREIIALEGEITQIKVDEEFDGLLQDITDAENAAAPGNDAIKEAKEFVELAEEDFDRAIRDAESAAEAFTEQSAKKFAQAAELKALRASVTI